LIQIIRLNPDFPKNYQVCKSR